MKHTITLLLLIGTFSASGQWLTDSLIAHFPMDGSPNELIGGLAPVVTSGVPAFCADRHGATNGAACFDGASYWSYGDVLDMGTSDFAIAFWMRVDTVMPLFELLPGLWNYGALPLDKGNTVVANPIRSGYSLLLRQDEPGIFNMDWATGDDADSMVNCVTPFLLHEWIHVSLARCDSVQTLHVNGALASSIVTEDDRDINTNIVFTFGAMNRDPAPDPDSEYFEGALDDVRIYKNRCLSQAEIDTLAFDLLTVGVAEPKQPALTLSPNPVGHLLTIALDKTDAVGARCLIMDGVGRTIKEQPLTADRTVVDVIDIPSGAYFVKLQAKQWQAHGKFIKE